MLLAISASIRRQNLDYVELLAEGKEQDSFPAVLDEKGKTWSMGELVPRMYRPRWLKRKC